MCFLILPGIKAGSYEYAESFLFSFREGCDSLLSVYENNAYELERLEYSLPAARLSLQENEFHLLIVAHAGLNDFSSDKAINELSLRAGELRAYIKLKFQIPDECSAFYIDRSGRYENQVHLYLVRKPLPWFVNQAIHGCESWDVRTVKASVKQYGIVPYVNLSPQGGTGKYEHQIYVIDDPLFSRSELEDYDLLVYRNWAPAPGMTTADMVPARSRPRVKYSALKKLHVSLSPKKSKPASTSSVFLAVKTNLLPLCGVVSSCQLTGDGMEWQRGACMPNLEVECYFADCWSVALSGMYADFSYKGWKDNKWAVSGITLTPRFWPLRQGGFRWLSIGAFGEYGDFDVRGEKISSEALHGKTGRYLSAGVVVGCLAPLGAGFGIEAEVEAGYRSVFEGKSYRYDAIDNKNYLEGRFSSEGFLIGVKLNLVYRFAIW